MTDQDYENHLAEIDAMLNAETKIDTERFNQILSECLEYEQSKFPVNEDMFTGTDLEWLYEKPILS